MESLNSAIKKLGDNLLSEQNTSCFAVQIQGIVRERNTYRQLLDECLYAFNVLPDQRITGSLGNITTYMMASKIDAVFRQFDDL
jgi:hypothetical protein